MATCAPLRSDSSLLFGFARDCVPRSSVCLVKIMRFDDVLPRFLDVVWRFHVYFCQGSNKLTKYEQVEHSCCVASSLLKVTPVSKACLPWLFLNCLLYSLLTDLRSSSECEPSSSNGMGWSSHRQMGKIHCISATTDDCFVRHILTTWTKIAELQV